MNETLNRDLRISRYFNLAKRLRGVVIHTRYHTVAVFRQTQEADVLEKTVYSPAGQHVNTSHQRVHTLHSQTSTQGSKLCHSVLAPLR